MRPVALERGARFCGLVGFEVDFRFGRESSPAERESVVARGVAFVFALFAAVARDFDFDFDFDFVEAAFLRVVMPRLYDDPASAPAVTEAPRRRAPRDVDRSVV